MRSSSGPHPVTGRRELSRKYTPDDFWRRKLQAQTRTGEIMKFREKRSSCSRVF